MPQRHLSILAAVFTVGLPLALNAQSALDMKLSARIDSVIQAELMSRGTTSASLIITRSGKTVFERTWGFADVEAKRAVDANTAYRLGSMSKHITAALILRQVERGKLSLSDTLGRFLSGLKTEWTGRSIETLLNHTSGVPREFRDIAKVGTYAPPESLIALAARSTSPTAPVGSTFMYSNTGYMLLAALVEKLYGKSYSEVLRDEIARPLGLTSLGWCGDLEAQGKVAKGYMKPPNGELGTPPFVHPSQLLAGGICSNAADIAKWSIALHSGKVISARSYAAMTTPRGAAARANVPYGFGMYVRDTPGGGTVMLTDGATPGYSNENVWYPAESMSLTLLTSTSGPLGADTNLTELLGRIVLGRPAPTK